MRRKSFLGGWASGRRAALGILPTVLVAQGLPPLPEPQPQEAEAPDLPELLPYRPYEGGASPGSPRSLQWRGERVLEGPDGWTIEGGAVQSEDLLLLADSIHYQPATGMLLAEGHIRLEGPGLRLRCERLQMDWKNRIGEAWALELELPPSWTLKSDKVSFTTLKHWDFENVELSPCPQERPGWSASLSRLKLDLDGFATLWNARVFVGGVWLPPYYIPWATYPAKAERSPGLLPPLVSYSSRQGATLGLSYYQTLGDSMDATLSPEFFSKENPLWGGEYRWNPEPTHNGSFQGQYIHQSDDQRRYRYSLKDLWQREDGWQFTADINQASDSLVDADYGRGIGNLGSTSYDSAVYLGKDFPWASLSFSSAEQKSFFSPTDPYYQSDFPASMRKQTLPEMQGRMYPLQVGNFYVDAGFRLSRLAYRLDFGDSAPSGSYAWNRDDVFTRLQGRLGQWGPFRADMQLEGRYTSYGASLRSPLFDPESGVNGTSLNAKYDPFLVDGEPVRRFLGSGRLQLSGPQLGRNFQHFSFLGYTGELKHVLEPFMAFTETSKTHEEGNIPRFDDVDSRPGVEGSAMGEQSLEFGLKQHLLGRPGKGDIFADLVRWKISTKYHFQPILLSDGRFKQGWASIDNDIDVEPNDRLRVSFRRSSDVGASGADNSLSMDIKVQDGSRFNLAYFSTGINRFLVRQQGIQLGGLQRLWDDRIRLEFQANYDYRRKIFASSQAALAYVTPCVATSLRYTHIALAVPSSVTKEDRLDLVLTLHSLGDLFKSEIPSRWF